MLELIPILLFNFAKVSVSVSKKFGLEKKSRYRSQKYLVSKNSLGLGLENVGLEKKSRYRSRWNFLVSSLSGELWAIPLDDDCHNSLSKASKGWGRARTEWVSWLTRGWLEVWLQIGESWMKTPVTSSDWRTVDPWRVHTINLRHLSVCFRWWYSYFVQAHLLHIGL